MGDLQKQVKSLEKDLREQAESVEEVRGRLRGEYDRAFKIGRTAATWASWRDERVTQAAVAWVLGTVFVRFCEDNGLLPEPYLAGPGTSSPPVRCPRTTVRRWTGPCPCCWTSG